MRPPTIEVSRAEVRRGLAKEMASRTSGKNPGVWPKQGIKKKIENKPSQHSRENWRRVYEDWSSAS